MLNGSGEWWTWKENIQAFLMKCDVSCGFLVDALDQVEEIPFCSSLCWTEAVTSMSSWFPLTLSLEMECSSLRAEPHYVWSLMQHNFYFCPTEHVRNTYHFHLASRSLDLTLAVGPGWAQRSHVGSLLRHIISCGRSSIHYSTKDKLNRT